MTLKTNQPNRSLKTAASLACLALLLFVSSASAQVTITTSNLQGIVVSGSVVFTPAWVPAQTNSLIYGMTPATATGTFTAEGRGVNHLSTNINLSLNLGGVQCSNYCSCGNGAGNQIIYTLTNSGNGFNLTNITVYGGWTDSGRYQMSYNVYYSTVANPSGFILLTNVFYAPSITSTNAISLRSVINDAAGGSIAANVYAVEFLMTSPPATAVANGWSGWGAITVGGTVAPSVVVPLMTAAVQSGGSPFTPTWAATPETNNDLILGIKPIAAAANGGNYTQSSGGTNCLTDGAIGISGTQSTFAGCGGGTGGNNAITSLIYTLTNSPSGSDVTNIIVYSGWGDTGRYGQFYTVYYSIVSAPLVFYPLTTIYYLPATANAPACRVDIALPGGARMATNVASIKLDFNNPLFYTFGASVVTAAGFNNGWQGYSEIIVQGTNSSTAPPPSPLPTQDTLPSYAETVVGDQISFSSAYTNGPPAAVQWQQIVSGPATNNISTGVVTVTNSGIITSTLTLTNLQLTNSGTYTLKAVNATNGAAAPSYSTGAPLVVSSVPAAVANVIQRNSGQIGLGPLSAVNTNLNFYPVWTVSTTNDLVLGSTNGSGTGAYVAGAGSYNLSGCNANVAVLSDGADAYYTSGSGAGNSLLCSCGSNAVAGTAITYTLNNTGVATNGYSLTNIAVYGGWPDHGLMEQKYQVLYSTVMNPTNFISLGTFDYIPTDTANFQCANRTVLSPAVGALATNVYAVRINWNISPAVLNGWSAYSEVVVQGTPTPANPILAQNILPSYAETVVGDQVAFTAAFLSNSIPFTLQWQYLGTNNTVTNNISGATTATLSFSSLQVTNTGYYRLAAINATNSGLVTYSMAAQLVVGSMPAATNNIIMQYAGQVGLGPISTVNASTNFSPTWTANTNNDLILGFVTNGTPGVPGTAYAGTGGSFDINVPSYGVGPGPFSADPSILSDGSGGYLTYWVNVGGNNTACSCGGGGAGAGDTMTYTLAGTAPYGITLTNVTVYGGNGDAGRNEQKYQVLYSTVAFPTNFISLGTFDYNPTDAASFQSATRTMLVPAAGALATNVYAVKINWNVTPAPKNNWEGYSEIVVKGTPSAAYPLMTQATLPATAANVVGDTVVFTAAFSNTPAATYQWQYIITNGATPADISGATTATLTLTGLQTNNSGYYRLKGINATNSGLVAYSTLSQLTVSSVPAAVNNMITEMAAQTAVGANIPGTSFTPTWTVTTNFSLIAGAFPSFTNGNFSVVTAVVSNASVSSLTAGGDGTITVVGTPGATSCSSNYVTCGNLSGAGAQIIYSLTNAPYGIDLTNITVYGGWTDAGRDQQAYTVYYSNIGAPTNFFLLGSVNYNPVNPGGAFSVTRATLLPASGLLARNVATVKFDFTSPGSENGYVGYSQILIGGTNSGVPYPLLSQDTLPSYAETVVGDQVTFTTVFASLPAANLQWQYLITNGATPVNLSNATNATLTLTGLQLTNSGYYRVQAINATNSGLVTYTTAAQLAIGGVPVPVNNVSKYYAGQCGLGSAVPNFTPTWPISTTNDLVLGSTNGSGPGTYFTNGAGSFGLGNANADPTILSDGSGGNYVYVGGNNTLCSGGTNSAFGLPAQSITYTLNTSVATNGFDVTNLTVYGGWGDGGRNEQKYQVLYSTVANPTNFISLGTYDYNPTDAAFVQSATRMMLIPLSGTLARNVSAVTINWNLAAAPKNGYEGYGEIMVQGVPTPNYPLVTQDTLPSYAETVVGDSVVFTAAFSNAPAATYQWQYIDTNSVVTAIANATNTTLTLSNVQLTDSGSYRLQAVNATNSLAVSYSTPAPLVVSPVPAAVGGMVVMNAGQCGFLGNTNGSVGNFYTAWTVNTSNNLIYGSADAGPGVPGTVYGDPVNNFADGNAYTSGDPAMLTDGDPGYITYRPSSGSATDLSLGNAPAGTYVQYTLGGTSTTGYDLTNITVYGGWVDAGRNEQKYEVLYSTVAAPTVFNHLITVDYVPTDANNTQVATRTTVLPAGAAMVPNVYAVKFNFSFVAPPKAGWEGYSEIVVAGVPSAPVPILTQAINPNTAEDVVGGTLTMTANFSSGTPYTLQWMKNGTNAIAGATNSTLTLSNLQLTDTATNGGYSLVASNASGTATTTACAVKVDPAPTAVSNVVSAFAIQTSIQSSFTPTWDTTALSSSLIAGQNPPSFDYDQTTPTNFSNPHFATGDRAGGLPVLTDGNYGVIVNDGTHPAFADCGNNADVAGRYVIYKLGAAANGYDVTNLQITSGWNDNGRDSQYYTVRYSTVANPGHFIPLLTVSNNLIGYGVNDDTEMRGTFTPAAGVLASNVYALYVDFTTPTGVPNNYSGISEISVFGSPTAAAIPEPIAVTVTNENTNTPDYVIETPSLIGGQTPSSVGSGNFAIAAGGIGVPALTDGTFGVINATNAANFDTCGGTANGAGTSVTYTCTNGAWNLTNIVVYSGWGNYNRDGQFYNITYATLADTNTFLPLTSVFYNPLPPVGVNGYASPAANRVAIAPATGFATLATNVYAVKFDFTPQTPSLDYGYSGYAEIVLQGVNVVPPASTNALLTSLALTPAGTLYPAFDTGTTNYTATNTCANNPVAVTVTNADLSATNTLYLNGVSQGLLTNGVASALLTLSTGANTVTVEVVSQDLSHTNDYVTTVTLTAPPVVSVNSATICAGGSTALTATNNASSPTYLWSPGGATTQTITVSPGVTTNYTVLVTDSATGCVGGGSGTVTVNPLPVVTVNSAAICAGGSTTLTATNNASSPTYLWSPGGATTQTITVSPGVTTNYTVLVTDGATGCVGGGSGTVTVNPLPVVTVNSASIYTGGSATLTATNTASSPTYLWSPGGATSQTITASPSTNTTYTVTVTDGTTGCVGGGSGTVTVLPNTNALVTSLALTPAGTLYPSFATGTLNYTATNTCANNPLTVTVTNADLTATNWLIYNGATNGLVSGSNSAALTLVTGANTVTVRVVSQDLSVTNDYVVVATLTAPPTVSVNSVTNCGALATLLTATSSASSPSYLWSDSETTASITVTPGSTTNYTVTVTDGTTGCANSGSGTITVNPVPTVSVNSTNIYAGGTATLAATTSASTPSYLWSPGGATTASITVSPSTNTTYTVTVTDGTTGCANSGSGTVTILSSTNSLLASLTITPAGTLFPTFASGTAGYNATNVFTNNPVTVAATSSNANATLQFSFNGGAYGAAVTNSLSAGGNNLVLPVNTVAVRVVSQDLSKTNTYTVNVLLQPSATVPKLTNSVSGTTLTLTWPADHLGYRLLVQTNNLSKGVSGNISDWGTVPGTATITTTNITIIKVGVTNQYYKLVYP